MSATAAAMKKQRILKTAMLAIAAASTMVACGGSSSGGATGANAPNTTAPTSTPPIPTASVQTVTLTPANGLKNAQGVQVVGKGYTSGKVYVVTECADKGADTVAADCNQPGIKTGTADATGTVTVSFPVVKTFGSNKIVCSASQACVVSVATADQVHPSELASAKITFA